MTGELELCAAAFFRTVGKDVVTADEFVMEISLGQKWFAPSKAKALLAAMVGAGVLESKDGYIRPSKDLSAVDVPLAYRPARDILTAGRAPSEAPKKESRAPEGGDPFPALVNVAAEAGVQRREFVQECNRVHRGLGIDIAVAALIALRDAGVDIGPHAERVRAWIVGQVTPS